MKCHRERLRCICYSRVGNSTVGAFAVKRTVWSSTASILLGSSMLSVGSSRIELLIEHPLEGPNNIFGRKSRPSENLTPAQVKRPDGAVGIDPNFQPKPNRLIAVVEFNQSRRWWSIA